MKVTVKVTQEDIDQGYIKCAYSCALARAINILLNRMYRSGITGKEFYISQNTNGRNVKRIDLPEEVQDFIRQFDRMQSVSPFEFEVDIPAKYLREPAEHK
jgi:hypothetical protein